MLLTLVGPDHPALTTKCPEFDFAAPAVDPKAFSNDLAALMYRKRGLGLAAPQVGQSIRVFVMLTGRGNGWTACFNPIVMASEDRQIGREECLSFPGVKVPTMRANRILARWWSFDGREHTQELDGLTARIFQHETDHMDGIVIARDVEPAKNKTQDAMRRALAMKRQTHR